MDKEIFDLVRRAKKGNREAFEELVYRLHKLVYAFSYRRLGDQEMAAEATQEIFLRLFTSLESLAKVESFFPWLFSLSHNVCGVYLRKGQRRKKVVQEVAQTLEKDKPVTSFLSSVEQEVEAQLLRQKVLQVIGELPEHYQLPLMLRLIEDLSYREIAEILGMTQGKVIGILFRGIRYLRKRLEYLWED